MDIISLQKATKAKREMKKVKDRLGDGVQSSFANVKGRLEALEARKIGENAATYLISTDDQWKAGTMNNVLAADGVLTGAGSWIGEIEIPDAVSLSKIGIETKVLQAEDYTPLIQGMTSGTAPAPQVATASSGSGYAMFSDSGSAAWRSSGGVIRNSWVMIDLGSAKNVTQYTMSTGVENSTTNTYSNSMPGSWRLEGSNDGTSWTTIDTRTATAADWGGWRNWSTRITKTFQFANANNYRYYRFYFVQTCDTSSSTYTFIVGRTQLYEQGSAQPIYVNDDFSTADVTIDTGRGFEALGSSGIINSKFNTNIKVKIAAPSGKTLSISKLSITYRSRPINMRISEVEKMVAINLNKHNLRVAALLNKARYKLTDMVVDDFADLSGIDTDKSTGYAYDGTLKKISVSDNQDTAEVVTVAEKLDAVPEMLLLSEASAGISTSTKSPDLASGTMNGTDFMNGAINLHVVGETSQKVYATSGTYETAVIDMGDNYKSFNQVTVLSDIPTGSSLKVSSSTSEDGVAFTPYTPLNPDGSVASPNGRYIKFRCDMESGTTTTNETLQDFTSDEVDRFETNPYIQFDGAAKFRFFYRSDMQKDSSFADSGSVFRGKIKKSEFQELKSIEVN
ncbi:hypothetical protein TCA2_4559 [Paenibacillus sp. TCA20]|uniref:hypothetical protein n=1 Tax=Paenibacillus sp. TCA20 TaxID=1499968 RepID=UPI0004D42973|nr:hypothetical protein [Paenibacillus sp. TCA20]GAK42067.1 hypothetical protein TCA2_4559 [Paenibacillus sp. TCA20]